MVKKTIHHLKKKATGMMTERHISHKHCLTQVQEKARRKRMSCYILTLAVILLVIPGYIFLYHRLEVKSDNIETIENQELYSAAGVLYRHINAYSQYCRKAGYTMVSYPRVFLSEYEKEILVFEKQAYQKGLYPDKMVRKIQNDFARVVQKSISKEFDRLRKQNGIRSDMQKPATDEEICRYLDQHASDFLKTDKKADIEKLKKFGHKASARN